DELEGGGRREEGLGVRLDPGDGRKDPPQPLDQLRLAVRAPEGTPEHLEAGGLEVVEIRGWPVGKQRRHDEDFEGRGHSRSPYTVVDGVNGWAAAGRAVQTGRIRVARLAGQRGGASTRSEAESWWGPPARPHESRGHAGPPPRPPPESPAGRRQNARCR